MKESKDNLVKFATFMKAFGVNCGIKEITKDQTNLYFTAFKAFPISDVEKAFSRVMYSWIYNRFPPVGVFMRAIEQGQPLLEDAAQIQATEILNLIRTVGAYSIPIYSDPTTKRIMSRRFNFSDLCKTLTIENEVWFIKNFKEAYHTETEEFGLLNGPKKFKYIANDMFESVPTLDEKKRRVLLNDQKEIILKEKSNRL